MISYLSENNKNSVDQLVKKAYEPYKKIYTIKKSSIGGVIDYKTIVLNKGSDILATLSFYIDGNVLRLFRVAVAPESQDKGCFKSLLNFMEAESNSFGIKIISLYTIEETEAYKSFIKCGFTVVNKSVADFAVGADGKFVHELEMIKKI